VEDAPALIVEDRDFRLVHYFTFTPWQVYQEYFGLKSEVDGQKLNNDHLLDMHRFEGQKTEVEIEELRQELLEKWLASPLQKKLAKKREEFLALRQTIELRAEKVFNTNDLEILILDTTGLIDAGDYESGKKPGTNELIDATLRPAMVAAVEVIKNFLSLQRCNLPTQPNRRSSGRKRLSTAQIDARVRFLGLVEEKVSEGYLFEAAITRAYHQLDKNEDSQILDELSQIPAPSTVRGWRRLKTPDE